MKDRKRLIEDSCVLQVEPDESLALRRQACRTVAAVKAPERTPADRTLDGVPSQCDGEDRRLEPTFRDAERPGSHALTVSPLSPQVDRGTTVRAGSYPPCRRRSLHDRRRLMIGGPVGMGSPRRIARGVVRVSHATTSRE
jgi:hypothetical protein